MKFSLSLPGETIFGAGRLAELPALAQRYGRRVAIAWGGDSARYSGLRERVLALLATAEIAAVELPPQRREPEPDDVDAAAAFARAARVECIIGCGGGSVLDLAKATAALVPQDPCFSVRSYLEGVGEGRCLLATPLPCIAVPTSAGTGTEATKNAVISSTTEGFKKSLRDRRMLPAVALLDPELTLSLPPSLTAQTGLDALTQLIESFTTRNAQPVTDALALRGLHCASALPIAYRERRNIAAREQMMLAAYISGVCLANAGLGAAHGLAAAFGSVSDTPHGLACAIALPWVMAVNMPVATEKYAQVAVALSGCTYPDAQTAARAALDMVWNLLQELSIPRAASLPALSAALAEANLPATVQACHGNSLRGNPQPLDDAALFRLLRALRDEEEPGVLL